jgi:hypothetical protein
MNASTGDMVDYALMQNGNENWTILPGSQGDISDAAKTISDDASKGISVTNVFIWHHGAENCITLNSVRGINYKTTITPTEVNQYQENGLVTTKGKNKALIESYLYSLGKISNAISKGGI